MNLFERNISVVDDAGGQVDLVRLSELQDDSRMADPVYRLVVRRVRQRLTMGRDSRMAGVALCFTAGMLLWIVPIFGIGGLMRVVVIGFYSIFACWILVSVSNRHIKRAAKRIVEILLLDGICPSCGYSLIDLHKDETGLVGCPECNAMWTADRMKRAHSFVTDSDSDMSWHRRFMEALDSPTRVSLRDDRRVRHPLVNGRLRCEIAAARDPEHRRRLLQAKRAMVRKGRLWRLIVGAGAILIGVVYVTNLSAGFVSGTWLSLRSMVVLFFFVLVYGSLALGWIVGNTGFKRRHVRKAMWVHKLCPSCGADLHGEGVEADGCTVCLECGAAWNLSFAFK